MNGLGSRLFRRSTASFVKPIACGLVVLLLLTGTTSSGQAQSLGRDEQDAELVNIYYTNSFCSDAILVGCSITPSVCAARVAEAKLACPAFIGDGLPGALDDKQRNRASIRSCTCVFDIIPGKNPTLRSPTSPLTTYGKKFIRVKLIRLPRWKIPNRSFQCRAPVILGVQLSSLTS